MIYLNTNTFDHLISRERLPVTRDPGEATLLVLGAKRVDYPAFRNLKAVYRFGVGTENVDFDFLRARSIPVHFPGNDTLKILYDSTADFTVYGILHMLCRGAFGDIDSWTKTRREHIGHKTSLVVGVGNIGGRVAERLAMFMNVRTYDSRTHAPRDLEPLVREADVVTVHMPLNADTNGYFDREKLSWVKDGALLVNAARGALFDEEALFEKLENSNCRAFFDVFWEEPYRGKLKGLGPDRFFMTPHSAANTREFVEAGFRDVLSIWKGLNDA